MPSKDKWRSSPSWLILAALAGGFVLAGTTLYLNLRQPTSQVQLQQLTVPVTKENLQVAIQASGTVEPIQSVNISPKNPGILMELKVEQGERVDQGQLLAVMENRELQAQKAEAEANLQQAIAALKEAETQIPQDIAQLEARLDQFRAKLAQARASLPRQTGQAEAQLEVAQSRFKLSEERVRRNQYLIDQGAISQDEFDAASNEFKTAQAALAEAEQRLAEVSNSENPEEASLESQVREAEAALAAKQANVEAELNQLKAAVEARQAQLDLIEVRYQDTFITAPFTGIITQRYATAGAFVTPTTSASSSVSATSSSILALATGLEVIAKVPEIDLSQLHEGQAVKILADAYPEAVFEGKVQRIAPEAVVEENVTSFEVVITIISGLEQLRSKMNVDVSFAGQELKQVLLVPTVAILTEAGQTGVMIPNQRNQPQFQPVTIGVTVGNKTQILEGLEEGERVFVDLPEQWRHND